MRKFKISQCPIKQRYLCEIRRWILCPGRSVSVRTCGCVGDNSVSSPSFVISAHRRRIASKHMTVKNNELEEENHCPTVVIFGCAHRRYLPGSFGHLLPSLREMSTGFSWFQRRRSISSSLWLPRSFFPFDFPARLLRTSTFPVMHSLLPGGTTKTDNLEEEGSGLA